MFEITTYDGEVYQIIQNDPKRIAQLAQRLDLVPVRLVGGEVRYFAKGSVSSISYRKTQQEALNEAREAIAKDKQSQNDTETAKLAENDQKRLEESND